mmetsp:Transcript_29836/g.91359  ORF Transcript_29836/g.91359 Transcript_29836/m.91359 type:complete len:238 (+) Transcript_29836:868-1581(+)
MALLARLPLAPGQRPIEQPAHALPPHQVPPRARGFVGDQSSRRRRLAGIHPDPRAGHSRRAGAQAHHLSDAHFPPGPDRASGRNSDIKNFFPRDRLFQRRRHRKPAARRRRVGGNNDDDPPHDQQKKRQDQRPRRHPRGRGGLLRRLRPHALLPRRRPLPRRLAPPRQKQRREQAHVPGHHRPQDRRRMRVVGKSSRVRLLSFLSFVLVVLSFAMRCPFLLTLLRCRVYDKFLLCMM